MLLCYNVILAIFCLNSEVIVYFPMSQCEMEPWQGNATYICVKLNRLPDIPSVYHICGKQILVRGGRGGLQ